MQVNFGITTQSKSNSSSGGIPEELAKMLKAMGIPDDIIQQGITAVMKYAQEHKLNLSTVIPGADYSKSSSQTEKGGSTNGLSQNDPMEEYKKKVKDLGVPEDVIIKGIQSIQEFAKQHDITLPPEPQKGSKLNLVA